MRTLLVSLLFVVSFASSSECTAKKPPESAIARGAVPGIDDPKEIRGQLIKLLPLVKDLKVPDSTNEFTKELTVGTKKITAVGYVFRPTGQYHIALMLNDLSLGELLAGSENPVVDILLKNAVVIFSPGAAKNGEFINVTDLPEIIQTYVKSTAGLRLFLRKGLNLSSQLNAGGEADDFLKDIGADLSKLVVESNIGQGGEGLHAQIQRLLGKAVRSERDASRCDNLLLEGYEQMDKEPSEDGRCVGRSGLQKQ